MLNMEHELVRLAEAINWASLVESFGPPVLCLGTKAVGAALLS